MISLKDWMETVDYRVTEGSNYCWHCFGDNAYSLDSWNGDHDGHSHSITFDRKTQTVYMVEVCDFVNERAYRYINPEFRDAYRNEVKARGVEDVAWEPVRFTDLETEEDWLEKARAIFLDQDYDTRVSIPLDFTDEELLRYMCIAHERDITFNQLVEEALRNAIEEFKQDPDGFKDRATHWKKTRDFA